MSSPCYVVTEGPTDQVLLERLLADRISAHEVKTLLSGGWSAALSTARSLAAVWAVPVALVVDADSTNEERIAERRSYLEEALGAAAAAAPWRVLLAVPEIEIVWFDAPEVLEDFFGQKFGNVEIELARAQPKRELNKLLAEHQMSDVLQLLNRLSPAAIEILRETPLIRELREFIEQSVTLPA